MLTYQLSFVRLIDFGQFEHQLGRELNSKDPGTQLLPRMSLFGFGPFAEFSCFWVLMRGWDGGSPHKNLSGLGAPQPFLRNAYRDRQVLVSLASSSAHLSSLGKKPPPIATMIFTAKIKVSSNRLEHLILVAFFHRAIRSVQEPAPNLFNCLRKGK